MNPLNNLSDTNFNSNFCCSFYQLFVISFFTSHSSGPETFEIIIENLFSYVIGLYSITTDDLFEDFEDDFSHFLFWCLELSD